MRRTKIVCTMGPNTNSRDLMKKLIETGMDVARFNFSHGDHDEQKMRMDMLKELRKELKTPVAILLDTKGPEIRTGKLKDGKKVTLKEGDLYTLTTEEIVGDETRGYINYAGLAEDVKPGDRILIDDGLIELHVREVNGTDIVCRIENGGELGEKKGVNVPGVRVKLPALTDKDKEDIRFGVDAGFDFVAASFVRNADAIREIREILDEKGSAMQIIAKIENEEGIENIDSIIEASDGIMVARGDMGVEIPMEELPSIQKMLIRKCFLMGKIAITATQMLESMIEKPSPTRAEISDVANAVYDGTSATMLSAESAVGAYPIEAVRAMARIAIKTESSIDYGKILKDSEMSRSVTGAVSHAACTMAEDMQAGAVVTVTKSGFTARMISKYRPACPIIAAAVDERVARQLSMSWGVIPVKAEQKETSDELFDHALELARETGIVASGDVVVITGGVPLGVSGTTNIVKVEIVGHVLCQGNGVNHAAASGTLCVADNPQEARALFKEGDILVVDETTNEMMEKVQGNNHRA